MTLVMKDAVFKVEPHIYPKATQQQRPKYFQDKGLTLTFEAISAVFYSSVTKLELFVKLLTQANQKHRIYCEAVHS